ncbi:polycomb group RING finger protein 6-like isoform X2 [Gymnodraco acuticeps]|uniref:Polycomb group RING finger protein 6 n=1 Tax=Gymnodraco acuticeps TaxID=8218 RepID=A0A6P8W023_GYMAC|nr:polycomb group RING finger protein 6-like isoform X2 [Gymnodraco acuticeps]
MHLKVVCNPPKNREKKKKNIHGTTRHMAATFPSASFISPVQQCRKQLLRMLPHLSHEGTTNDSKDKEEPNRPLSEFYPYIRCALCSYFLIDATTIIECLHTFCKSCIMKHFFYSNRCPTCSTVVHQTQPTYNIRPDRKLQDIVYKMVPFLEESERKQMCQFYKERGLDVPNTGPVVIKRQKKENIPPSVFTIPPELDVSLLLEFVGAEEGIANYKPLENRYVLVSGEPTVRQVEIFIRRMMELSSACQVEVVCGNHLLDHSQSLKDIQSLVGEEALQDGLLVLHFGLVLPSQP